MERLNLFLILFTLVMLATYITILRMAVKRNFLSHNAFLFWFAMALMLFCMALYPTPIIELTMFLGFEVAANGVFFLAIGFLMMLNLLLSIELSKQKAMLLKMVQEHALDEAAKRTAPRADHRLSSETDQ